MRLFLLTGLVPLFLITLAFASSPRHKATSTFEDFLKGEADGISITSDGKLILSPSAEELLDTDEAFVYSISANAGGTIYVGTGNNGKIFRLLTDGTASEWATVKEPGVYALAVDSQNHLYAGTGPEGKVYRLDSEGEPQLFFDPKEKYIWDLLFDANDNLYVATGPKGEIYKVGSDGTGKSFYDSEETHIVDLALDLDQNLLAGTAPGGVLVRLSTSGHPFVLLDTNFEEVRSIATDRYGNIFAAALSGQTKASMETKSPTTEAVSDTKTEESTVKVAGGEKGAQLEVYKINRDNLVETLYASKDELVFDTIIRNDGSALLATGNKGRVLAVSPKGLVTLLVDSAEEQVTRLLSIGDSVYTATSNLGKVIRISTAQATKGVFRSEVLDAEMVSRWGTIRWLVSEPSSKDSVKILSRSGNTGTPDRTWSDWSKPYENARGSSIQSPSARFLQWKVEISREGSSAGLLAQNNALERVSISYLQQNAAPRISELTVHSPGVAFAPPPQVTASGGIKPGGPDGAHALSLPRSIRELETSRVAVPARKIYIPGARSFSWKASDPNKDDLNYSLFYRREIDEAWTPLKKDSKEARFTLDGASFPDGTYVLKVVASDQPSNPKALSLEHELVSKPFVISNSAPIIEWGSPAIQGGKATLQFTASSGMEESPIYQVEYSVDGSEWQILFPQDDITDQSRETFLLEITDLTSRRKTVRVRVVDLVGNIGTSMKTLQIP